MSVKMKRSEMIALMAKVMEESFDGDNGCWETDAEKVLEAMENAGILPPFSHAVFNRNWAKFREASPGGNDWDKEDGK